MYYNLVDEDIAGALKVECEAEDPSLNLYLEADMVVACSGESRAVHELVRLYKRGRHDFLMPFADYLKGEGLVARKGRVPRHLKYHLEIAAGRN